MEKKMTAIDPIFMGKRIKEQRILNGYSREKLAEMAEITPRFCYDIELGLKNMSVSTLCKLCDALHVSVDYILYGSSSQSENYDSILSMITLCPPEKRTHLIQIISHFIQAVQH